MTPFGKDSGRHPTAEELLAYSDGERAADGSHEIQEHLMVCEACTRIVLDLAGEGKPGDQELMAFWDSLRQSYSKESGSTSSSEGDEPATGTSRSSHPWLLAAAGALLLIGTFFAGTYLGRLNARSPSSDVEQAQRVISLDLVPESYLRNGEPSLPTAPASTEPPYLALRLLTTDGAPGDTLRVEVRAENGDLKTELSGLILDAQGRLELLVARRGLAAGTYAVEIFPEGDAGAEPVHRYRFALAR